MKWLTVAALLACSGCVSIRSYSEQELADVGRGCGMAQGEIYQDPDEPRFLFLMAEAPSSEQLACVRSWTNKRRLHLGYIDSINWKTD